MADVKPDSIARSSVTISYVVPQAHRCVILIAGSPVVARRIGGALPHFGHRGARFMALMMCSTCALRRPQSLFVWLGFTPHSGPEVGFDGDLYPVRAFAVLVEVEPCAKYVAFVGVAALFAVV